MKMSTPCRQSFKTAAVKAMTRAAKTVTLMVAVMQAVTTAVETAVETAVWAMQPGWQVAHTIAAMRRVTTVLSVEKTPRR